MAAIFEASPEGFRAQNLARPPAHLVRELIQNVFDEKATRCEVTVKWTPAKGVQVTVTDDVEGGFRDEKLVFTIWESDKSDDCTRRGRMGRGLKEIVSVADETRVQTQGRPSIVFKRTRDGEWTRRADGTLPTPAKGTTVHARIGAWNKAAVKAIIDYLDVVRPPAGVKLIVNDMEVKRVAEEEAHTLALPTIVYEKNGRHERYESHPVRNADVHLFKRGGDQWVYEMGLPIETIDYPFSIDVQQRIPLREQRDTMLTSFSCILYARLLNARNAVISHAELRDKHVLRAMEYAHYLNEDVLQRVCNAWTEGRPYASNEREMEIATGAHIPVVALRTLPEQIRSVVKTTCTNVMMEINSRRGSVCPVLDHTNMTDDERRLCSVWEWLAKSLGRACTVQVRAGPPVAEADFDQGTRTMSLYREGPMKYLFAKPLCARALSTFIHELSHWKVREEQHGIDFNTDTEDVGALLADFLLNNSAEALEKARTL